MDNNITKKGDPMTKKTDENINIFDHIPLDLSAEERKWGMWVHMSALAGVLSVPLLNVIVPLIIWMMKKDLSPWVNQQGKEALNFNLSVVIYGAVSIVLMFVLIGVVLLGVVLVFWFVCVIWGAIKANNGFSVRYPLTIRFIK